MAENRPSWDEYFLRIAKLAASRGTCRRRKVGCVLVDQRHNIIATGYNGPSRGFPHCIDTPCAGADAPSGTSLEACEAIHAEQNALMRCTDIDKIETCYSVASPCVTCIKLLLNTNCQRIVFAEEYPHSHAKELWLSRPAQANPGWIHLPIYDEPFSDPDTKLAMSAFVDTIKAAPAITGWYRHYKSATQAMIHDDPPKSELYNVLGVMENGDTHDEMVVYRPPEKYGNKICVRPLSQWQETVTIDMVSLGKPIRMPRFERVKPAR